MCISSISRVFHVSMQYPRSVAGSSPEPGIMSHGDAVYGTDFRFQNRTCMTLTWFEHAAFWSGVRRATVAPQSLPWRRQPLALTKRTITNVAYKAEISTDLQKFFLDRAWQDSNLQSPDPKSGTLSIRPHALKWFKVTIFVAFHSNLQSWLKKYTI